MVSNFSLSRFVFLFFYHIDSCQMTFFISQPARRYVYTCIFFLCSPTRFRRNRKKKKTHGSMDTILGGTYLILKPDLERMPLALIQFCNRLLYLHTFHCIAEFEILSANLFLRLRKYLPCHIVNKFVEIPP